MKRLTFAAILVLIVSMVLPLSGCMKEENYYTKADIEAMISDLEAELAKNEDQTAAALELLKSEHKADIALIEAKVTANEAKITELTATYNAKLLLLEKADVDNAAEIAELKSSYETELAKLQAADSDNSAAIKSLTDAYNAKLLLLEKADVDNAAEIAELKSSYETELAKLQAADSDNSAAIKSLTDAYNAKVLELEGNLKTSTQTINGLIDELKGYDEETATALEDLQAKIAEILAAIEKTCYIVTFDTDGGTSIPNQQVLDGKKATEPEAPTKVGYIFDGWYFGDEKWSFIGYSVTEDITLTAKWVECTEHVDDNDDNTCDKCDGIVNVYYADFGAKGDGITDDFFAIKACHDYANQHGCTVNSDGPDKVYYIGRENGTKSITVKTDTYWNCCTFIWDDSVIDKPAQSKAYLAPIFDVAPDKSSYTLSGSKLPVSSILSGATTVGDWKPGERVLISIYDNTQRHYIRYGSNQNNGTAQTEIIIVNADGTIDPDTPVQWDYTNLSKMEIYPCNDKPITISGGTKDQVDNYDALSTFDNLHCIDRTKIITYFNNAPSEYKYHARNINITRSNVTIKNLEHVLYDDVETSAPYTGFIKVYNCTDVTVEGMIFQKQKGFSTSGASGDDVGMGSYEISANNANRVTWRHCRQSNFFNEDGSVTYKGYMGTNYCKNLTFDDMVSCSFDAHCGLYNGTIKNSTIEHLNFIGDGLITVENTTLYLDGSKTAIQLRADYGATWRGDLYMKNVDLKYQNSKADYYKWNYSIVSAGWNNHYFGYTCYLPQDIYLENVNMLGFDVTVDQTTKERTETVTRVNEKEIYLFTKYIYTHTSIDLSDPDADMTSKPNDYTECKCYEVYNGEKSFNDTDGDGRCNNDADPTDSYSRWCWGHHKCECDTFTDADENYFCDSCLGFEEKVPTWVNANPYIGTKTVTVINGDTENPLKMVWPFTPQFKDLDVTVDGVQIIKDGEEIE